MREDMSKMIVERPRWTRFSNEPIPDRLHGLWFAAPYRQCAEEATATHVYDVIKQRMALAGGRYAVSKRQLLARELTKQGLQDDNRRDGGPPPQRHTRQKRKRTRS